MEYYRIFLSLIYSHSNYPLIYSLIGGFIGSFIENENPVKGFVIYSWTFLILYITVLVFYIIKKYCL